MDARELFSRIARLPIAAEGLATSMLSGSFRSAFRGQGMEFDEARHYQWGDDAKSIDWNASTRLGTPFVKVYREERELSVLLLLDASASMRGGLARPWGRAPGDKGLSPYEQALLASALVALSAERGGQRVGALLFDRGVGRAFPPRKGRRAAMAFLSEALRIHSSPPPRPPARGASGGSDLRAAVSAAGRMLKRRSMVVVASDFMSAGWEGEMGRLCRRHDVIAARVFDPAEGDPPDVGLVSAADPETGERIAAPTGSPSFREAWAEWHGQKSELWRKSCRKAGAAALDLPVTADAAAALARFFGGRAGGGG